MNPILKEIDLSKTTKAGGAGLEVGPIYLVLYNGNFHTGTFSMMWYGLTFNGIYGAGASYDPPPHNSSSWQRIWVMENAEQISAEAEPSYMERKRRYAIDHHLTSYGQAIDETAPLEAFAYHPKVSAMPKPSEDDES